MLGVSRAAHAQAREALQRALDSGADWRRLSEDLFAFVAVLDGSHMLRRALADPSRSGDGKRELVGRLLAGKVDPATLLVVGSAVTQRWSDEKDLPAALEWLAVESQIAIADAGGHADDVEEQLFRFERTVAATPELREALGDSRLPADRKLAVVRRLLEGRVQPEALRLVREAVTHPRGRRFAQAIEHYLDIAAVRRQQLSAVVTVAAPLTPQQHTRLESALSRSYGRPVMLKILIDPEVLGGIRVQVGDEVMDGTIVRRLDEARRLLGS